MKILYTMESKTDNNPIEDITIKCNYEEFTILCEMLAGNVPNGDLETELLSEFEVAQDAFDIARYHGADNEKANGFSNLEDELNESISKLKNVLEPEGTVLHPEIYNRPIKTPTKDKSE